MERLSLVKGNPYSSPLRNGGSDSGIVVRILAIQKRHGQTRGSTTAAAREAVAPTYSIPIARPPEAAQIGRLLLARRSHAAGFIDNYGL